VDALSAGYDDQQLAKIVLGAHAKLQSRPYPRRWADGHVEALRCAGVEDLSETVWGKHLIGKTRLAAEYWKSEMDNLAKATVNEEPFNAAWGASIAATANASVISPWQRTAAGPIPAIFAAYSLARLRTYPSSPSASTAGNGISTIPP
jgi:hypothetical protein